MENLKDLKLCSKMCVLFEYKGKKFGVNGCGWAPCESCVNESEFSYNKGYNPVLDKIYASGCERGYNKGVQDSVPPCNWD